MWVLGVIVTIEGHAWGVDKILENIPNKKEIA